MPEMQEAKLRLVVELAQEHLGHGLRDREDARMKIRELAVAARCLRRSRSCVRRRSAQARDRPARLVGFSFAEIGTQSGIFAKHGLELQVFYTSGGGETQQAVISGSADIGVSPGTLGVLGAFAKGAPIRIIAGEATGTAEYYFVKADSPCRRTSRACRPEMTLAYSTNGSGTHITALRFMKDYGFAAKLVATGNVPATFTPGDVGQVDIGFSTPPFGLDAFAEGRSRLIALANDLPSVRNQTVRVTIANANDLAKRPRRLRPLHQGVPRGRSTGCIPTMPRRSRPSPSMRRSRPRRRSTVRDQFYPKAMLQLDRGRRHGGTDAGRDRVQIHSGGADASSSSTSCCNCPGGSGRSPSP